MISYLASPYSHRSPAIRRMRYLAALTATKELMLAGKIVYSPIVHWHMQVVLYDMPYDHLTWKKQNDAMMNVCSELLLLQIDGWKESRGVRDEVDSFTNNNKPILHYWIKGIDKFKALFVEYDEIEARISNITKIELARLKSKTRVQHVMLYKHIARYLYASLNPHVSHLFLSKSLNVDHTTFRHSMQVAKDILFSSAYDKNFRSVYDLLLHDFSTQVTSENNLINVSKIAI